MEILNDHRRRIVIDDHVWIGRRAIVMPDVKIGFGSVIAAGAILTSNVPEKVVFAGVPARMVRQNVTWSRHVYGFSEGELAAFGEKFGANPPVRGGHGL
ncbi:acyltransferase [Gemmobacter megaterium]|nr:hypothetical protein [Gemmobacter megaterium]